MQIELQKGYLVLQCEFCRENIALFKPEELKRPLDSSMFEPIINNRGLPPPFPYIPGRTETLSWESAQCPYHKVGSDKGPVPGMPWSASDELGPIRVNTPHGFYEIGSSEIPQKPNLLSLSHINQEKIEQIENNLKEDAKSKKEKAKELKIIAENAQKEAEEARLQLEQFQSDSPKEQEFYCKYCKRKYKHQSSLSRHQGLCLKNSDNKRK